MTKNMTKHFSLLLFVAAAFGLQAQTTQVSATVTSSENAPYAFGTYRVTLVNANGVPLYLGPGASTYSGASVYTGSLDANGSFTVALTPNASILAGSQWNFTICSAGKGVCFTLPQTIAGSTQSLTVALSAVAPSIAVASAPLLLPADPVNPLQAATKNYVDTHSSTVVGTGASTGAAGTPQVANGSGGFSAATTIKNVPIHDAGGMVIDVTSSNAYGTIANDGSNQTTQSASFFTALPAGKNVYFPAGSYCVGNMQLKHNQNVTFDPGAAVVNCGTYLLGMGTGLAPTQYPLTSGAQGASSVVVSSFPAGAAVGDRILIDAGTYNGSGVEHGPNEWNTITSISGTAPTITIGVAQNLRLNYASYGLTGQTSPFVMDLTAAGYPHDIKIDFQGAPLSTQAGNTNAGYFSIGYAENVQLWNIEANGFGSGFMGGSYWSRVQLHHIHLSGAAQSVVAGATLFANPAGVVESLMDDVSLNMTNGTTADSLNSMDCEVFCHDNTFSNWNIGPVKGTTLAGFQFTNGMNNRFINNRIWGFPGDLSSGSPGIRNYVVPLTLQVGDYIHGNVFTNILTAIQDQGLLSDIAGNLHINDASNSQSVTVQDEQLNPFPHGVNTSVNVAHPTWNASNTQGGFGFFGGTSTPTQQGYPGSIYLQNGGAPGQGAWFAELAPGTTSQIWLPRNADPSYTVAQLPGTCYQGQHVLVTNALSPTALTTLTGGGSVQVQAFCNGSNQWLASSGGSGGGGSSAFSAITPGSNTGALTIGNGGSLGPVGTGVVIANQVPVGAGLAPTTNGQIGYDSTVNVYRAGLGGGGSAFVWGSGGTTPTAGDCPVWAAGYHLNDSGYLCSFFTGGTSTVGQFPLFSGTAGQLGTGGTFSGNTSKAASVSGSLTSGNCIESDASHNLVDAGSPCGSGSGSLPSQTGNAGLSLITNGTTATFGAPVTAGATGALVFGVASGVFKGDINTSYLPTLPAANVFAGLNEFALPLLLDGQASAPSNPAAGKYSLYFDNSGNLHTLTPSGTNTTLGSGGSAGLHLSQSATVALTTACAAVNTDYYATGLTIPANTLTAGSRVDFLYEIHLMSGATVGTTAIQPQLKFGSTGSNQFPYLSAGGVSSARVIDSWDVVSTTSQVQNPIYFYGNNQSGGYFNGADATENTTSAIVVQPGLHCGGSLSGVAGNVYIRYQLDVIQ